MKDLQKTTLIMILVGSIVTSPIGWSQQANSHDPSPNQDHPAAPSPHGGSATAGVFNAVKDSELRPITAGGFVKDGPTLFDDIADQAGLTVWHHVA
jgi:hypothetical protein